MMQTQANLLLLFILPVLAAEMAPFHAPAARSHVDRSNSLFGFGFTPRLARLVKREDLSARRASTPCCPLGAECTGTLMGTTTAAPGPTQTPGPTPAPTTSTSSGFMFPQPGTTAAPTPTGSTVPGAPFPFVYIPTTFHNSAECVRSYSGCQSQFSACTASLGGAYGVTINGGNGAGVTVQGAAPTGDGQAICSSLLLRACFGLQEGYCTAFGNGGGTPNGSPQPPHRQSALYEILAGLSIAIAGMIA
ncbi:hypothetical protein MGYG_04624 [Nannizzia gypsea CBS 118893]|uniref:Uncharacterized protein n=1 Tax=Arthroderma gypseum (strain ATCC MYA-4604 / CBS 118893) TaxID=535722 RepID=E4UU31_ARTGP|nr:hypothetical protein MGYG_04624 [Nannizzia gypsea CBS 118893]EFR01621.1 hypothetical protein MGYG_04624 [Nannizzia gypsea CBS 118893]